MTNITRSAKACLSLLRLRTAEALQYRMAALASASASTGIFWVLIEITVFTIFYTHGANRNTDIALSLPQMITYL